MAGKCDKGYKTRIIKMLDQSFSLNKNNNKNKLYALLDFFLPFERAGCQIQQSLVAK
jgi:hypothetical protein